MPNQPPTHGRLIKLAEVLARTGKSRSSLYGDATFPRPIKIGARASAWIETEVDAWISARVAGLSDAQLRQLVSKLEQDRKDPGQMHLPGI